MTISEACKINLKECETYCNESQIFPAMRYFIEQMSMSELSASKEVEKRTDNKVTAERARFVWINRKKRGCANAQPDKFPKTQTKPETKIQISKIADEIKSGAVSDDHAKQIGDALADAITDGTCAKRVTIKRMTSLGV